MGDATPAVESRETKELEQASGGSGVPDPVLGHIGEAWTTTVRVVWEVGRRVG